MWERITPPKMVPSALVSLGSSSTLMAGMRSSLNVSPRPAVPWRQVYPSRRSAPYSAAASQVAAECETNPRHGGPPRAIALPDRGPVPRAPLGRGQRGLPGPRVPVLRRRPPAPGHGTRGLRGGTPLAAPRPLLRDPLAAVTALVFEAALRLAPGILHGPIANVAYTGYHWHRGGIYDLDAHAGPLLRPDVHRRMYWQGHWWHHHTNADGYRGPREPHPDALFLGDSMVYGHGVEDGETLPAQFAAVTGRPVANLGQQGTSLLQSLMIFERKGLALRPRVVYVVSHPTDLEETVRCYAPGELERFLAEPGYRPLVRDEWQPRPAWDPVSLFARRLALPLQSSAVSGALLRRPTARDVPPPPHRAPGAREGAVRPVRGVRRRPFEGATGGPPEERLAWRVQSRAALEIKRACDSVGARMVLLDLGYPEALSRAVEALATEIGVAYSPAGRVVLDRALAGEEMYLVDDGHWTPAGCRAMAEELARRGD